MQQNNIFINNKTKNRFRKEEKELILNAKENFKSDRIKEEKFTNYFQSNSSIEYKILNDIYNDYISGINILDKYFNEPDYLYLGSGQTEKINRVLRIAIKVTNKFLMHIDVKDIFKMNLKENYCNDKIRFYFKKNNNELDLLFIDLFHLGILTKQQKLEIEYNKYKDFTGNILSIKIEKKG